MLRQTKGLANIREIILDSHMFFLALLITSQWLNAAALTLRVALLKTETCGIKSTENTPIGPYMSPLQQPLMDTGIPR